MQITAITPILDVGDPARSVPWCEPLDWKMNPTMEAAEPAPEEADND